MDKNSFNIFLGRDPKRKLSDRVISDYKSRIRSVPKILKLDFDLFFEIDDPKILNIVLEELESNRVFKSKTNGRKSDIRVAYRRYLEYIEKLNEFKLLVKSHLKELDQSYKNFQKGKLDEQKATKFLVSKISKLFTPNQSISNLGSPVCQYLKLKDENEIKEIYRVSKNLLLGKNNEMIFTKLEATAKVIAIKSHLGKLNRKIN